MKFQGLSLYTPPCFLRLLLQGPSTHSQGGLSDSITPLFSSLLLLALAKRKKKNHCEIPQTPLPYNSKDNLLLRGAGRQEGNPIQVKTETPSSPSLPQFSSVHFSSVTHSCLTLCDHMNCSTPDLLSINHSQSSLKLMSIESVMSSSHHILCRHLLLPLPSLPASESVPMSQIFT